MDLFMLLMETYFTTRKVTVPVVFACICWIKSVAALQGDARLGRNVSLTFNHSTYLMRNINDTLVKGTVQKVHKKSNDLLQMCGAEIERSTQHHHLSRANPLLAGFTMLDHHFKYLHIASEILLLTTRNYKFKKRKAFHLSDMSKTFRLMIQNDKAVLEGASWTQMLEDVANTCSAELFDTHVLSRDLLKLNDDLAEFFIELCGKLKQETHYNDTVEKSFQLREMEDGVIMVLLQVLDMVDVVDTMIEDPVCSRIDLDRATNMCKKAADVIRQKFGTSSSECDQKYNTFSSQPDFVNQNFGSMS
ncbi:hypothetical protein PHMEG_0003583 [Phytophthora megakarya]|uniref:Uncharacterized protein n=1 Tax=Phytophthora megakarya TaxID=4795 RepID=A0A225WVW9_9STRA|nr:hypothetical protein PHMEG_0003583 [Phytophthora megakarya]